MVFPHFSILKFDTKPSNRLHVFRNSSRISIIFQMVIDIELTPSQIGIDQILSLFPPTPFIYPAPREAPFFPGLAPRSRAGRTGMWGCIKISTPHLIKGAGFTHDGDYLKSLAPGFRSAVQANSSERVPSSRCIINKSLTILPRRERHPVMVTFSNSLFPISMSIFSAKSFDLASISWKSAFLFSFSRNRSSAILRAVKIATFKVETLLVFFKISSIFSLTYWATA